MLRGGVSFAGATVSCVLKPRELDSTDNVTARIGVRIVSADGLTVRAVLLAVGDYGTGLEVDVHPGATTRIAANAQALASYVTQPGDRPVVEVGYSDTSGTTPQARGYYGTPAASLGDAPLADSGDANYIPWFQFTPAA